jgi:hypothetical protein
MTVEYNVDGLRPCPVCGKKDRVYLLTNSMSDGDSYSIGCDRCEIDLFSSYSREHRMSWWNNLPRGQG